MEVDKWTVSTILTALKNTNLYRNQSDYYIKKAIGNKYNLTTVKKENLIEEYNTINIKPLISKAVTHSDINNDIVHNIFLNSKYNEIIELCSVNKQYYLICQNENLWLSLLPRDFSFIYNILKPCFGLVKKYNTYKSIYELLFSFVTKCVNDIFIQYEKKRKTRYSNIIKEQIIDIILTYSPSPYKLLNLDNIDDKNVNKILTLLNVKTKLNGDFYAQDIYIVANNIFYLQEALNKINCTTLELM